MSLRSRNPCGHYLFPTSSLARVLRPKKTRPKKKAGALATKRQEQPPVSTQIQLWNLASNRWAKNAKNNQQSPQEEEEVVGEIANLCSSLPEYARWVRWSRICRIGIPYSPGMGYRVGSAPQDGPIATGRRHFCYGPTVRATGATGRSVMETAPLRLSIEQHSFQLSAFNHG